MEHSWTWEQAASKHITISINHWTQGCKGPQRSGSLVNPSTHKHANYSQTLTAAYPTCPYAPLQPWRLLCLSREILSMFTYTYVALEKLDFICSLLLSDLNLLCGFVCLARPCPGSQSLKSLLVFRLVEKGGKMWWYFRPSLDKLSPSQSRFSSGMWVTLAGPSQNFAGTSVVLHLWQHRAVLIKLNSLLEYGNCGFRRADFLVLNLPTSFKNKKQLEWSAQKRHVLNSLFMPACRGGNCCYSPLNTIWRPRTPPITCWAKLACCKMQNKT